MDENRYITDNVLRRYLGMDVALPKIEQPNIKDNSLRRYLGLDWVENPVGFITIKGNKIPLKEGETAKEAVERFVKEKKMLKIENFLGKEYTDVKGQAAIDLLMKEKQGFVREAFMRKDIGAIALIWGNDEMGLQHIIKRRKETKQPLGKLLSSLTEVIEQGEIIREDNGDFVIRYKGKKAIIEPQLFNNKIQFLMTAYYEK